MLFLSKTRNDLEEKYMKLRSRASDLHLVRVICSEKLGTIDLGLKDIVYIRCGHHFA